MTGIDWNEFDAQRLDYESPDVCTVDDVRRQLGLTHDEFLDRLHKALDELPDPPFWFRVRFFFADCAWRARRRLFKP